MAKNNENKPPLAPHLQHVPEYINVDSMRREEFLSQIGNFASEHRKIFQSLCENWQPGINYVRFVTQNSSIRFVEKDLVNLMSRLKTARCGLIKHKCINGDLKKNTIILTDKEDKSYYYHLVENEIEIATLSAVHPMLTSAVLRDQGIKIPDAFIDVLTPRNINRDFFNECKNDGRLFKIPTSDDEYFIATSDTLAPLITMSIKRVREGLKHSSVLSYVAKLQSSAIMEIKREMSTTNPNSWRKMTVTILDAKDEIIQKSRTVNSDFFTSCELIRFFSENEIKASEKRRAEELEMLDEMRTIAHAIAVEDSFFVDQSDLNEKLENPSQKYPGFKDKFYENFVKVKKKTQLPQIVYIGSKYIHRDNIYTYFVRALALYSGDLQVEYQKLMESLIRTNNKSNVSVFFSNENFRNNIREKIMSWDPMMISFLDRPAVISEAVIHMAKKKMKVKDVGRIKVLLENYFEPGRLKFKSLEILFNLNVLDLFQYAFLKIPLWKQLFIRILGRYDSYRRTFTGMNRNSVSKRTIPQMGGGAKKEPDFSSMSREDRKAEYKKRQNLNSRAGSKRRRSPSPAEQQVVKRRYTKQEQNEAWTDFTSSFQKKKRSKEPESL